MLDIRFNENRVDLFFYLYENVNKVVIQVDDRLNNIDFFRLIHYLYEDKKSKLFISAFTIGEEDNKLRYKRFSVFILPNDFRESVSIVTEENENYRIDIDGRVYQRDNGLHYKYPDNLIQNNVIVIGTTVAFFYKKEKSERNTRKRFLSRIIHRQIFAS